MSVAKVLDPAISFVDPGTFAVDRVGMKKDVMEKWEIQTITFVCPNLLEPTGQERTRKKNG